MFLKRNTALHATAYILYMNYIFELFILMSIYLTIQKIYSFPMNWLLQTKHNLYLPNQASNWQTCYSVLYNIITCRRVTTSGVTYSLMKKSMALAIGKCPIGLPIFYVLIIHSIFSGFALDEKLHRNDSLPYFWNTYVSHPTFTRASKNWHLRNVNIRQANRNFFLN